MLDERAVESSQSYHVKVPAMAFYKIESHLRTAHFFNAISKSIKSATYFGCSITLLNVDRSFGSVDYGKGYPSMTSFCHELRNC